MSLRDQTGEPSEAAGESKSPSENMDKSDLYVHNAIYIFAALGKE